MGTTADIAHAFIRLMEEGETDSMPADQTRRRAIEEQIERESHAFFVTARLYDDGVIDPRHTRSVLGIALSAAHSAQVAGQRGFGVFRM